MSGPRVEAMSIGGGPYLGAASGASTVDVFPHAPSAAAAKNVMAALDAILLSGAASGKRHAPGSAAAQNGHAVSYERT